MRLMVWMIGMLLWLPCGLWGNEQYVQYLDKISNCQNGCIREGLDTADEHAKNLIVKFLSVCKEHGKDPEHEKLKKVVLYLEKLQESIEKGYARDGALLLIFGIVPLNSRYAEIQDKLKSISSFVADNISGLQSKKWDEESTRKRFTSHVLRLLGQEKEPDDFVAFLQSSLKRMETSPNILHCLYGNIWIFSGAKFDSGDGTKHTGQRKVVNSLDGQLLDTIVEARKKFAEAAYDNNFLSIFCEKLSEDEYLECELESQAPNPKVNEDSVFSIGYLRELGEYLIDCIPRR